MSITINDYYALKNAPTQGNTGLKDRPNKVYGTAVQTQVRRMRYDVGNWRDGLKSFESEQNPNPVKLFDIYSDALIDALLSSQMENRKLQTIGTPFELQHHGTPDDESTALLRSSMWFGEFLSLLLDTSWWGHSLFEFSIVNGKLQVTLIPRKNVRPKAGLVLKNQNDTNGTAYRNLREYGTWIIEAGATETPSPGLLNKAVPHVLMKRFAQSCWSEFCEIFGMPMRKLKTNTSDPAMLNRAQEMMYNTGAANWVIIDESEEMEFAEASNANGEVYKALITLCNSELSLLASGAIIGQDTEHGTRGKEQVSADMLYDLVKADRTWVENYCNSTLLPALYRIGYLPDGLQFKFKDVEDVDGLWKKTSEALPYFDFDPEWINDKFGMPVTPKLNNQTLKLNAEKPDFFG